MGAGPGPDPGRSEAREVAAVSGMQRIMIWGAGGHARVVADIIRRGGGFEIAGFLDDVRPERQGEEFAGGRVLGDSSLLSALQEERPAVALGVGDCGARVRMARRARELGLALPVLVHPSAVLSGDASAGAGSVLVAGAVVNPGARLGAAVLVNTLASVDHDCTLEEGVHVGPGARLGGGCVVGREAWIGIGAVVRDGVRIGQGSLIGAGAVVVQDIPPGVVAYGTPARVVRPIGMDRE